MKTTEDIKARLEYLRGELRAERISYGEIAELQSLAPHIDPSDVELLEAAGVPEKSEYEQQADSFLSRNGIRFRATLSNSKSADWQPSGHHYRVTLYKAGNIRVCECGCGNKWPEVRKIATHTTNLSGESYYCACGKRAQFTSSVREAARIAFDFWGSVADMEKLDLCNRRKKEISQSIASREHELQPVHAFGYARNELSSTQSALIRENLADLKARISGVEEEISSLHPSAYDVLACISSDVNCPNTFEDFCSEYGYESDSIKALQTFRRCSRFAARLRSFFTPSEIEELQEIR